MCDFQRSFLSSVTQRYLPLCLPWDDFVVHFHVGFKSMCHLSYHFWRRAMFCLSLRVNILGDLFGPKRLCHRRIELCEIGCCRSKVCQMLNNVGHSREPCGTPAVINLVEEIICHWFELGRYDGEGMNFVCREAAVLCRLVVYIILYICKYKKLTL